MSSRTSAVDMTVPSTATSVEVPLPTSEFIHSAMVGVPGIFSLIS